jgi:hypothetical protein
VRHPDAQPSISHSGERTARAIVISYRKNTVPPFKFRSFKHSEHVPEREPARLEATTLDGPLVTISFAILILKTALEDSKV